MKYMLTIILIAALLVFASGVRTASAEPYIAMRTGYKCSTCHVNKTGGGKRTAFGLIYAQTQLPMAVLKPPDGGSSFDPNLGESVSLGANLRVAKSFIFEHENSVGETFGSSNTTDFPEANLYVQVDAIEDVVTFYADQTLAPSSSNRELFGMFTDTKRDVYVKVGRMLLPYGLRLIDNDAFVRNRTGYTYARSGTGVELGWEPRRLALVANVTDERFSTVASIVYRRFQLGGSFGRNITRSDDVAIGPFAGANFGRVTLLGEVDFIKSGGADQVATLAELNYLIVRGFNVKFTYEFFDRNSDVSADRDGQERYTIGVEPFLAQLVQVRAFYRINKFIPQNGPLNQDQAILEVHVFF